MKKKIKRKEIVCSAWVDRPFTNEDLKRLIKVVSGEDYEVTGNYEVKPVSSSKPSADNSK